MRYFFVFLAIAVVWLAIITIAAIAPGSGMMLYFAAQLITVTLFFVGFYSK